MWNEYKRPIWTDNPFAKDKLELGFNAYEASHCCFGEDGTDAENVFQDQILNMTNHFQ